MMYRNKSSVFARFKPLFLLPVITLLTLVFACSETPGDTPLDYEMDKSPDEMIEVTSAPEDNYIDNQTVIAPVGEEVFYIVEEMPKFNGGEPAHEFRKYVAQNLQYPKKAEDNGIEGRVIIQFAVDKDGKVVDAVVVRSVDPALDQESIRVVMSSPEWEPGKQKGKAVKVLFTFPINFVKPN